MWKKLIVLLSLAVVTGQVPVEAAQNAPDYNSAEVGSIIDIQPGFYWVPGGGANSVIRVTSEGIILVDTKNPDAEIAAALIDEIRSVSTLPVRYVLNTHHHPDHVGNNQAFVDEGATIIGLERMREQWVSDPRTQAIPGLPTVTFEGSSTLRFGGVEVQAHYFGSSHTDGDTVVFFPAERFVMVSDSVPFARPTPGVSGTNAVQMPALLDSILDLDFDSALAGRGPVMTRAEIEAYKTKWNTFLSRARAAIRSGATVENLISQVSQDDLGWTFNANFFAELYSALGASGDR